MTLEEYDVCDLARKAGALHLLPENADYYAELIRISAVVASLSAVDEQLPKISDFEWRQRINSTSPMHGAPKIGGDPAEGPFVVEVPCFGGAYLTIPADNPQDAFTLSCLLIAIFRGLRDADKAFLDHAASISLCGLWLSNSLIRSVGLKRNQKPTETENDEIRWPHNSIARGLENAVTFDRHEVTAELAKLGVDLGGLGALSSEPGANSLNYALGANPVCRRPFLIVGDQIIAISPSTIVPAVIDALLELAHANQLSDRIAESYRTAVHHQVRVCAKLQRWDELGSRTVTTPTTTLIESLFQVDADKVLVAYLVCDDLSSYSAAPEQAWWNLDSVVADLETRFVAVEGELEAATPPRREILHVVVVQSLGRPYFFGIDSSSNPSALRLALSADELRIFSLLNLNDSLALWHVARAKARLPKGTAFLGGGFLDYYALYRRRQKAFYLSDDRMPDMVAFSATGIDVRLEAHERLDPHTVRRLDSRLYGTVLRLQSRSDFPIYAWQPLDASSVCLLVEGLPFPVWVISTSQSGGNAEAVEHLGYHLVDAIAFWIWQLTSAVNKVLEDNEFKGGHVLVKVAITDAHRWFDDVGTSENGTGLTVERHDETTLCFFLRQSFHSVRW